MLWSCAIVALAVALVSVTPYAWRKYSELVASTLAQVMAPAPAPRPWLARTILDKEKLDAPGNTWLLKRLALQSRGETYRLQLKLTNGRPNWCGLMSLRISDADRKVLSILKAGYWIWPRHSWEGSLSFRAPRSATKFILEVSSEGWDCQGMEIPIAFR